MLINNIVAEDVCLVLVDFVYSDSYKARQRWRAVVDDDVVSVLVG